MTDPTILFVDNTSDFLEVRSEFLEGEGYRVIQAHNPAEARSLLSKNRVDVIVLDIRLLDDDDEKDVSGISLAKEISKTAPTIILTAYPSPDAVREALRPQLDGLPASVDFVSKTEGIEPLLLAIEHALGGKA